MACTLESKSVSHDFADLSSANRIKVTTNFSSHVVSITNRQQVAALALTVGRYRGDGWINVWSGATITLRNVTFYRGDSQIGQIGLSERGITEGGYVRPLPATELAALAGKLGITWPPPENSGAAKP
jgi:hypothetical protein